MICLRRYLTPEVKVVAGVTHMVYGTAAKDAYYMMSTDDGATFSTPLKPVITLVEFADFHQCLLVNVASSQLTPTNSPTHPRGNGPCKKSDPNAFPKVAIVYENPDFSPF
jgi:hypothetical protein